MSPERLLDAKDAACNVLQRLGQKLKDGYGLTAFDTKVDDSVVTELDRWAEKQIKTELREFDETIGFLGEEHGQEGNKDIRWLIDPIDGTEHFIRGIPCCVTMVALVVHSEVMVSVIYNFITEELYWAVKGKGAWSGDTKLLVSKRPMNRAMVDASVSLENDEHNKLLVAYKKQTGVGYTRFYGSGYTAMLVASGRIEGRISAHGKGGPWDYAPAALLIHEAGGTVSHLDGSAYDYERVGNFVAGSPEMHAMLMETVSR